MQIEFAFTRCASNVNRIHIDRVHTAEILKLNCCWLATPTAAQVTISNLALLSQHSRCIKHTKVHPIISLTLSLVVEDIRCVHTVLSMWIQCDSMRIHCVHTKTGLARTGFEPVRFQSTSGGGFDPVSSESRWRSHDNT